MTSSLSASWNESWRAPRWKLNSSVLSLSTLRKLSQIPVVHIHWSFLLALASGWWPLYWAQWSWLDEPQTQADKGFQDKRMPPVFKLEEFHNLLVRFWHPMYKRENRSTSFLWNFICSLLFPKVSKQLVSVDGIIYGFRSLHLAFSDKVVKLQLTHFLCMTKGVYNSRWCGLLGVEYQ